MKHLLCASVSRVLEAYHDGELPVEEQIVVESHLAECYLCGSEAKSLRMLRNALRASADVTLAAHPARRDAAGVVPQESVETRLANMCREIVTRVKAERAESLQSRVGRLFEDFHLVYAALAATTATVTCAAVVAAVLHFAPRERSDSLAGVLAALAAPPGSDINPMLLDTSIALPRYESEGVIHKMPMTTEGTDVFLTVSGVVTRDGRVTFPSLLSSPYTKAEDRRVIDAVSATRFEPAMRAGSPVAVNFVWLFERTTVRGGKTSS